MKTALGSGLFLVVARVSVRAAVRRVSVRACSLLMVLIVCSGSLSAQSRAADKKGAAQAKAEKQAAEYRRAEKEAVDYVETIDVKTLDPLLPSDTLVDWLRNGPPHVDRLEWMLDETCDLHGDGSDSDYPRCVRIELGRGGQSGYFLVLIGTLKKGIIGPPKFYGAIDVYEAGFVQTGGADRLSGLPGLLDQPSVSKSVTDLYEKVVARHPMGIPKGADKTMLWPFFSQRLIQGLETAQACQDDYFRQHPKGDTVEKPAWMTRDIFSGGDNRAASFFVNTVHKEALKDGSFAVELSANERDGDKSIVAGGIRAYAVKNAWVIMTTVVHEDGRFVVDDLRIFEGDSTDGPSRLLSEAFAGCDGARWTGEGVETEAAVVKTRAPVVDWVAVNVLRSAAYKAEVTFGQALDVHELDPSLPSERLEDWLKSDSLHVDHVEWNAGGCNIKEGRDGATMNPEGGLCAEVWFRQGNAIAEIRVGARGTVGSGDPKVEYIRVDDKDDGLLKPVSGNGDRASETERLSDLPRLLEEESVIDITRNLYDAVVARSPLGILQGADRSRISPLLSQRLRERFATAEVCREDYVRQTAGAGGKPKPAWLGAGLFSGEGDLTAPSADFVDHKERQADGSFLVWVWLSRKEPAGPGSAGPASSWRLWHVSAMVKLESGQFVVDDVRIFEGLDAEGPSHLLSESSAGCDGGGWVGVGGSAQ